MKIYLNKRLVTTEMIKLNYAIEISFIVMKYVTNPVYCLLRNPSLFIYNTITKKKNVSTNMPKLLYIPTNRTKINLTN